MATFQNPTTGAIIDQENRDPQDLANQGFVPAAPTTAPVITPKSMTPAQPIPIAEPEPTPTFDPASIEIPEIQMTEPEKVESGFNQRLQELNTELIGESGFRTGQEDAQGMAELQQTQTDLSSQLKAIQNEALQIPLQMQQEATGRGITAGGLAPLQTARLRTNAIQALGVNSLLEASRGNISLAQTMVDRAVAQKFDPIKAEITALEKNLNLIINSPEYDIAQKNRAKKQLEAQEAKKTAVAEQEAEQTAIWNMATEAAQNGADALTMKRIQDSKTKEEALGYMAEFNAKIQGQKLMAEGYTKISGPSQLAGLTEADILRLPNGDIYKKPAGEAEDRDTQVVTAGGRSLLIDKQTGETIADLGGAYKAGGGSATTPGVKLSTGDRGRLIAAGFNANEVSQIESDINEHGINTVIEGMSDEQAKVIKDVYSGVTPTQANKPEEAAFLNDEYVKTHWATEAAYNDSKKWWKLDKSFEDWQKDTLDAINANIKFYRDAGWTDKEIHKELLKNMQ